MVVVLTQLWIFTNTGYMPFIILEEISAHLIAATNRHLHVKISHFATKLLVVRNTNYNFKKNRIRSLVASAIYLRADCLGAARLRSQQLRLY